MIAVVSQSTKRSYMLRALVAAIALAIILTSLIRTAQGQEGQHGAGHELWHDSFYSGLLRPQYKTSCCSSADCRPTQSRQVGDHYEVMVDGAWLRVPPEVIL